MFAEAFAVARSGRPGPVLIDLPKDLASGAAVSSDVRPAAIERPAVDPAALARADALIAAARAPVLYFGGGIAIARAERALRDFAGRTGMPSVATLKGLGGVPTDDPAFLGMLGMHGTRAANVAIDNCDLLVCVGARLDRKSTGKLDTFAQRARVIHIDGAPAETVNLRRPAVVLANGRAAVEERGG